MKLKNVQSVKPYDLNHPLIKFSADKKDWLTVGTATRGIQIFGGTGSGKTSATGMKFAKELLIFGAGGIIHTSKPGERKEWEDLIQYLHQKGEVDRRNDLIIFSENSQYRFNPLEYEKSRKGKGAGKSHNLVTLLMHIYKISSGDSSGGKTSERFWDNSLKRLMRRMIDLLKLANEKISITNMHAIVVSLLSKEESEYLQELLSDFDSNKSSLSEWSKRNYYIKCFLKGTLNLLKQEENNPTEEREYFIVKNYFNRELSALHPRTKTIITESFLGIVEPFLTGLLHKHFAKDTTILPEWTHQGKIILLDFPIKEYAELGVISQGIFRYMWQQATERRTFRPGFDIPVFLWADEAQLYISDYEMTFQSTARSSGVITVYLSQNISGYYARNWNGNAIAKTDSLLGNLSTRIFHSNVDAVTNEWAARTIGKKFKKMISHGMNSHNGSNSGISEALHFQVEPSDFTMLRTGGPEHDWLVETVISIAGKKWSNGKNFIHKTFKQLILS